MPEAPTNAAFAAIDCGSHSTRLLIMRGDETLVRELELTKLGAGLNESGALKPDARSNAPTQRYATIVRYSTNIGSILAGFESQRRLRFAMHPMGQSSLPQRARSLVRQPRFFREPPRVN